MNTETPVKRWIKYCSFEGLPTWFNPPYQCYEAEADVLAKLWGCTVHLRETRDGEVFKSVSSDTATVNLEEMKAELVKKIQVAAIERQSYC